MSAWGITYIDKWNDGTCLYCDGENHLIGLKDSQAVRELASIIDLRYQMAKQRRDLELGIHAEGYLIPWEGVLNVKEGFYAWDELTKEYRKLADDEVEALKGKKDELVDSVRGAVFTALKAVGVDIDSIGVGTGWDSEEKPIITIHLTMYGEHHDFPFSREDIERKGVVPFAGLFAEKIKTGLDKDKDKGKGSTSQHSVYR
ncbi:hypothetical protein [Alicyclobacillus fastidiosus]|uniref:hypothetical protein n=1 Tax=Alicyclobacillus fastidiosus TaxID=392011 RepID=UPI0023E98874|nr:hypothetical protein [Alicyclobacillus fastidiosus]GMA66088.1 hypothetical protein GCM10025859_65300 [Alicyclobacillus fastidiosus]